MSHTQILNMLRYWRNSLADSARVVIQVDKTVNIKQALVDLKTGTLDTSQACTLIDAFERRANEEKGRHRTDDVDRECIDQVSVLISPFRVSPQPEYARLTGETGFFFPFWISGILDRKGVLKPGEDTFPYIPRAYLEPQVNQEVNFIFSDVDTVDQAFARPFNDELNWQNYFSYINEVFTTITGTSPGLINFDNFVVTSEFTIVVDDTLTGPADGIIGLYDQLLNKKSFPAILSRLAEFSQTILKPLVDQKVLQEVSTDHSGQMAFEFPLSISQRSSLYHYTTLKAGDILAINGPPGTGKTTLLQSVVATEVVKAALAGKEPAVILACSANNQAVTNIIDSFANVERKPGPYYQRWLPDLEGFGLYLPSSQRNVPQHIPVIKRINGFLTGDHMQKETATYLKEAEAFYKTRSGRPIASVRAITDELRQKLKDQQQALIDMIRLWQRYESLADLLPELRTYDILTIERDVKGLERQYTDYLDKESIVYKLLSFLGPIKAKREARFKAIFRDCLVSTNKIDLCQTRSIQRFLDKTLELIADIKQAQRAWTDHQERYRIRHTPAEDAFYEELETGIKYEMFYTAIHYWEGRWLLATQQGIAENTLTRNGESNAKDRWRRFAMLTPCFVSTFFMSPRMFTYSKFIRKDAGTNIYESPALINFIDLLIVDEAGQVSPEVGVATFALAKKALVVGDILQIEPVWNVPKKIDHANLQRYHVIKSINDDVALQDLYGLGFLCSSGSIMRLAQKASAYHQEPMQARGMLLTEHRRCFDEIIAYCNDLAYGGSLKPMKGPSKGALFPPLQFIPVSGISAVNGSSRSNIDEAHAIANWLVQNQDALTRHYHLPLNAIVAIVTPFSSQKLTLRNTLRQAGINTANLTIGTVHALQGAERPVVLFSATYGINDTAKNYFFDAGPNMLNVAVSRAKETFILFGAPEIFQRNDNTPSMRLYKHIEYQAFNNS